MERYNESFTEDGGYTSYLEQLEEELLDAYGDSSLRLKRPDGSSTSVILEDWISLGSAYGVLDAVEGYEAASIGDIGGVGGFPARS